MIVEHGAPPEWLSGTLARHACGVYGETGENYAQNNDGDGDAQPFYTPPFCFEASA